MPPKIIDVPGQGLVEFPESMGDDQIAAAIKANSAPPKPVAGSKPLPPTGDRLQSMAGAMGKGMLVGGPMGMAASGAGEAMSQFGQGMDRLAHKAGGAVSQALAPYVPGEVAGGAGYLTNVGMQAIPTVMGAGIGRQAAPLLERGAEKLMGMALKPSTTLPPEKAQQAIRQMLTGDAGNLIPGANVTSGGIGQIQGKIKGLGSEVQSLLGASNATVSPAAVSQALGPTRAKFGNQVDNISDLAAVDAVGSRFASTYQNPLSVRQAHDLKQGTYAVLGDKAYKGGSGEMGTAQTEAQKALARGLREETEKAVPAIAPINAEQGQWINAVKAAISRNAVAQNKDPIGLGFLAANPIAAGAFMANRSELVKSQLARLLHAWGQPIPTGVGAGVGAAIGSESGRGR